ncbi:hypothetical protein DPMN_026147, partial [Dreissena polymorpha]
IMEETNTQISWPSKLKIGAKSKKDPHIKVVGLPEDIREAKDIIMSVLDTKSNRATLKMDVSYTDHSHVIGKGGNNIKRVMQETGCHVHFPDSNRGNSVQEKSNQVSIAGQPQGVESARAKIRELLPLVFMFEIPATTIPIQLPDTQSPTMQHLQQQYNVQISFRQRQRGYGTTVIVRGSVYNEKLVKEATLKMMDCILGKLPAPLPVSMQLEIAPQHHLFIIGRGGMNIKQIMQVTGAVIHFPDPNTVAPQRKGLVFISGPIESVYQARQQLIGCLPLVLMFDVKEELEMDQGRVTQLMEHLDVYISVKPKPKQPSKSVIVKSIERNASNMYLARLLLLGVEKEIPRHHHANVITEEGGRHTILSLSALGYFSQTIQPALQVSTANQFLLLNGQKSPPSTYPAQLLLINGQKSPPTTQQAQVAQLSHQPPSTTYTTQASYNHATQSTIFSNQQNAHTNSYNGSHLTNHASQPNMLNVNGQVSMAPAGMATSFSPPSPKSPQPAHQTMQHVIQPPPGIYGAPRMAMPQVSLQNVVDLMKECAVTSQRVDHSHHQSSFPGAQTLREPGMSHSEGPSPSRSPCESPKTFRDCSSTVDLAGLSSSGKFVSHPKVSLDSGSSPLDLLGLNLGKPNKPGLSSSAHTMDLLGLSKTTNSHLGMGSLPFHSRNTGGSSLHGSLNHGSLHASLNSAKIQSGLKNESLRGSLHGSLNCGSLHASLNNGSLHGSLSSSSLHASLNRNSLLNGDDHRLLEPDHLDLRAPGIERKTSQSSLYTDPFQSFGGDYEEKKLMANKAMQKKPMVESSRTPTDYWSGLMFSKSMPTQAMREFGGLKPRYEPPMATTYESPGDEIMEMDDSLWKATPASMYKRPVDPAPGEFPSPRKKWPEYGLSASNHMDCTLVPKKSYWSPELDLAELFIKLGLGKYTDLFQQQEIDLPTFLTLTDHDLRELGISTFGARKKMLLAIADLNKRRMLMTANNHMENTDSFHEKVSHDHDVSHAGITGLSGW